MGPISDCPETVTSCALHYVEMMMTHEMVIYMESTHRESVVPGVCSVGSVGSAVLAGGLGSSGIGSAAATGSTVGSASAAGSACGSGAASSCGAATGSASSGTAKCGKIFDSYWRLAGMSLHYCYLPSSNSSMKTVLPRSFKAKFKETNQIRPNTFYSFTNATQTPLLHTQL